MVNILVCSIIRNQESFINNWYLNIRNLICSDNLNKYFLSVYQNDSSDNTVNMLTSMNFSFVEKNIISENIGTRYYDRLNTPHSNKSNSNRNLSLIQRLKNLSLARNHCIESSLNNKQFDYVLFIQPDISYNPEYMKQFLAWAINQKYDIVSPVSKYGSQLYDKWATRLTETLQWFQPNEVWNKTKITPVYSTFNCFCLYKALPFYQGVRFDYMNNEGIVDCDTVIICQKFRQAGYNNIYVNQNYQILGR